ncbi:Acyl-protein thioesterase 1 [Ceratocystis lukuohia]|uniref:Acyl-protein thioesterase 1 n=1 Tax=Ceratocystis lukuohia TaxID=2019550 RepID=A0ABR4MCL7_9PEZI
MAHPAPLTVPAVGKHTATIIFAHGLGDTCAGWIDVVRNWRLRSKLNQVKFVLPNAPTIPVTCRALLCESLNGTMESLLKNEDEKGILETRSYLSGLIKAEIEAGIAPERIILGGFSQGGAVALLTGLTGEHKLGGIVALSCWLVLSGKFKELLKDELADTPIFMAHGNEDPLVIPQFNDMSRQKLQELGVKLDYHSYPMGHTACVEEIEEVSQFMEKRLPMLE